MEPEEEKREDKTDEEREGEEVQQEERGMKGETARREVGRHIS